MPFSSFRLVPILTIFPCAALFLALPGCSSAPVASRQKALAGDTVGLTKPFEDSNVQSLVDPPIGWKAQPLKAADNHTDQVWLSPTGNTAYGVIHFTMPLPVGQSFAFSIFLSQMKKQQGGALLTYRRDDSTLPGIRFAAEAGLYVIRGNFLVFGLEGWTIYAGTLKTGPILQNELDLAMRAREHTQVGWPDQPGR